MINGVIAQKLQHLDTVLTELRSLGRLTVQDLEMDWRTKKQVRGAKPANPCRNCDCSVCQRILSRLGQTPATTGRDAMDRIIALGILGQLDAYSKMVQFRNFVVIGMNRWIMRSWWIW